MRICPLLNSTVLPLGYRFHLDNEDLNEWNFLADIIPSTSKIELGPQQMPKTMMAGKETDQPR